MIKPVCYTSSPCWLLCRCTASATTRCKGLYEVQVLQAVKGAQRDNQEGAHVLPQVLCSTAEGDRDISRDTIVTQPVVQPVTAGVPMQIVYASLSPTPVPVPKL